MQSVFSSQPTINKTNERDINHVTKEINRFKQAIRTPLQT